MNLYAIGLITPKTPPYLTYGINLAWEERLQKVGLMANLLGGVIDEYGRVRDGAYQASRATIGRVAGLVVATYSEKSAQTLQLDVNAIAHIYMAADANKPVFLEDAWYQIAPSGFLHQTGGAEMISISRDTDKIRARLDRSVSRLDDGTERSIQ